MAESQKFGEIIWPRLVARKLLRRRPGSHGLIDEFSGSEDRSLQKKSLNSQRDTLKYRVFASTWNVGGVAPSGDLDLEDWLDAKANSYDIYVLGFQEIVPLSARNVLGPEKSSISTKWNSLIGDTLNSSKSKGQERMLEHQACEDGSSKGSHGPQGDHYRCIVSKQMVGIFVSVWIRSALSPHVRHPATSCVGSGILGCLGNKGAVSVRFLLHETSFCFVCCHLASGGKEGDLQLRNVDAAGILSRTSFPRACGGMALDLPRKILDHDHAVLIGDLNYRISLREGETRLLVEAKKWSRLLERDQLLFELSKGGHFEGWQEGLITFSPTYKYCPNSDQYYGCIPGTGCQRKRAPAWCDRILWRGRGLKQIRYERCSDKLSDHRPVRAIFNAECEIIRGS